MMSKTSPSGRSTWKSEMMIRAIVPDSMPLACCRKSSSGPSDSASRAAHGSGFSEPQSAPPQPGEGLGAAAAGAEDFFFDSFSAASSAASFLVLSFRPNRHSRMRLHRHQHRHRQNHPFRRLA